MLELLHHEADLSAAGPSACVFVCDAKIKDRSLVRFALCPRLSAMTLDYALDDGEAYTRPLELVRGVESLEGLKDLVCLLHGKADPVILHVIGIGFRFGPPSDFDERDRLRLAELDGIFEQVIKYFPEHNPVSIRRGSLFSSSRMERSG